MSIRALDNLNRSRRDGSGGTIEVQDAENNIAWFVYDYGGSATDNFRARYANRQGLVPQRV